MGCFVFILMITLAVATTNPVEDFSYDEIVNNFNSLKEEIKQLKEENIVLHGKYNTVHERSNKLQEENIRNQKIKNKLKQRLKDTKTTLDEATTNNNALQSSNEKLEKELQDTKTSLDEATTNNNALQSSNEQCETELQNTKTSLEEATTNNNALQSSYEQCETELQDTKTTLDEATTNNNNLQSSNEQLEKELQNTKTTLDEATTNNNALLSSNEQCETELQNTKTTLDEATTNNKALLSSNEQCETELQDTKTSLDAATTKNNALQSSNEQLEKEHQNTKTTLDEATTNNKALQSSKEQCETELQDIKTTLEEVTTNMKDCTELYSNGFTSEGVYKIKPENSEPLSVYCQGGWTVIQKRSDDSVNYTKNMEEYGRGFGQIDGEHWLDLNAMNKLTEQGNYTIRFELEAFDGETAWAEYSNFHVSPGTDYTLTFDKSSYRGTAGDSLAAKQKTSAHNMKFTTYDMDQDKWKVKSCSTDFADVAGIPFGGGGWWFNSCDYTLTAMEYGTKFSINWRGFKYGSPLKAAVMKIKRV